MKIGYRTIKTAFGAALSIFIAQSIGLQFYVSAGTLTILSIQVTRKRSLKSAFDRLSACLLGLALGYVCFELLGYHTFSIALLILAFIPTLIKIKAQEGFLTGSVIFLHMYTIKDLSLSFLWNEIQIMVIGIGTGLLMNLYMPNNDRKIKQLQDRIEDNFGKILMEYGIYLRAGESEWTGSEMLETPDLLKQAKGLAIQKLENYHVKQQVAEYEYFVMREKQFDLLERILPIISTLNQDVPQGRQIAEFVEELSRNIHPGNTTYVFLDKIAVLRNQIKQTALPQTREEFETRASLFYLLNEFEQYLLIKQNFLSGNKPAALKEN